MEIKTVQVEVAYSPDSPPRRGALAVCGRGRMAIITGSKWVGARKATKVWTGIPVSLSFAANEEHKTWQSKDPVVIGYLNIEDLS